MTSHDLWTLCNNPETHTQWKSESVTNGPGKVQETQKLKGILLRNTLHTKKAGKKAVFWFYILIIMLGLLYSDYNATREQF